MTDLQKAMCFFVGPRPRSVAHPDSEDEELIGEVHAEALSTLRSLAQRAKAVIDDDAFTDRRDINASDLTSIAGALGGVSCFHDEGFE